MQSQSTAGSDKAGKFILCNCTPVIIQVLAAIGKLQSGWGICCRRLLTRQKNLEDCNKSWWELTSLHIRNLPCIFKYLYHGQTRRKNLFETVFPLLFAIPPFNGSTEFSQVPDHAELPILIPNNEAVLPHHALPVTPDWKRTTRGSQQLVLGFSEEKPASKKWKIKVYSRFRSRWTGQGLEVTFSSISTVLGEPLHKCWGWMFPARAWWLVTHQKEVFLLFCVSFCVGWSMTNQVPAVICPRPLHDILSQILLLCCV